MGTNAKEISAYEYAQINQFIYKLYMTYARGMEYEECRDIVLLEYAEARHEADDIYNREIIWIYARARIIKAFTKARKIRNEKIHGESPFSLNQSLGESSEPVYTYFFPVQGDFVKSLCMWSDIKELGEVPYKILTMLYQGYDDLEIIKRLGLASMQYYEIKREIRSQLEQYFEL